MWSICDCKQGRHVLRSGKGSLAVFSLVLALPISGWGESLGPNTAASGTTAGGTGWSFGLTNYAVSAAWSDDQRCIFTGSSQADLILTNFGFDLPSSAVVTDILVQVEGHGTGSSAARREWRCALTKNGSTIAGTQQQALSFNRNTDTDNDVSAGL